MRERAQIGIPFDGEASGKVKALFHKVCSEKFHATPAALLRAIVAEIVVSQAPLTFAEAEEMELIQPVIAGPRICQRVVDCYNTRRPQIVRALVEPQA